VEEEVIKDDDAPHGRPHREPNAVVEFAPPVLPTAALFVLLLEEAGLAALKAVI
jgi:hypothetical protein